MHAAAVLASDLSEHSGGSRDLAHELAEELAEELGELGELGENLAVEHAISETIGQGGATTVADETLQLERASQESPDALPVLPSTPEAARRADSPDSLESEELPEIGEDDSPSGGPELPLILPDATDGQVVESPAWSAPSDMVAAEEDPHFFDRPDAGAAAAADPREDVLPSRRTPPSWLSTPASPTGPTGEAPSRAPDEAQFASEAQTTGYESLVKRRETPAPSLAEPSRVDEPTIVGANVLVAEALERVAHRVRSGELRVPAVDESAGEAGALAAALTVLLGVRR